MSATYLAGFPPRRCFDRGTELYVPDVCDDCWDARMMKDGGAEAALGALRAEKWKRFPKGNWDGLGKRERKPGR